MDLFGGCCGSNRNEMDEIEGARILSQSVDMGAGGRRKSVEEDKKQDKKHYQPPNIVDLTPEGPVDLKLKWGGVEAVKPGPTVWRVEKMKVKKVADEDFGVFYKGDTYIVLETGWDHAAAGRWTFHAFFWIGPDSSQDEFGAASALITELTHDVLPGDGTKCHHTRIKGGEEPDEFVSLFPGRELDIRDGGVDSGFTHARQESAGEDMEALMEERLLKEEEEAAAAEDAKDEAKE